MMLLVIYTLLSTAAWYLGSRAMITQALWSRYPKSAARFFDCPACTGFWYGALAAIVIGWRRNLGFAGLAPDDPIMPICAGLCMIVCVPICAGVMQWGFERAGSVIEESPPTVDALSDARASDMDRMGDSIDSSHEHSDAATK